MQPDRYEGGVDVVITIKMYLIKKGTRAWCYLNLRALRREQRGTKGRTVRPDLRET